MNVRINGGDEASLSINCQLGDVLSISGKLSPDGIKIVDDGDRLEVTVHLYRNGAEIHETLANEEED